MMEQDNKGKMRCEHVRGDILLADFTKDGGDGGNGYVMPPGPLAHMETCASCRGFFEDVRLAARSVKMLNAAAPADFMEEFHEKLVRVTPRPFPAFSVLKPVAAAALFVFALLTALSLPRQGLKPWRIASMEAGNISAADFLKQKMIFSGKEVIDSISSVHENKNPGSENKKVHGKAPVLKGRKKNVSYAMKRQTKQKPPVQGNEVDLLHDRMVQVQVKSDRPFDNVSLVLETEEGAFLEGENEDGKILTWIGSVSQNKPVAILVPVKAAGKKAVKIKTTVVTSEGEILYESVSFKKGKKRMQIVTSKDKTGDDDDKVPGRFLVFIPSSELKPKDLPSSGISVSVQAGSLALSDARVENVAFVPNPGGNLELVFSDAKVELTDAQVLPGND